MAEMNETLAVEEGNISVHTENIFPIIKKSLYSDHEIFLRELVSNAVDATRKLRHLAGNGTFGGELGDLKIRVSVNAEAGTLTIRDAGIGMNADEVRKYINQVAFSGAEEFMKKYKGARDAQDIIGKFGLGFYSAFMVADLVEIRSRSWRKTDKGVRWTCDGSTKYTLEKTDLSARGTEIILHISEDSREFLETARIQNILTKYCRFLPEEIEFEEKVINNTSPEWTRKPAELKDEDYLKLFRELYPYAPEPLFWIHLNVDYPFELTGILFFPKIKNEIEMRREKIQLYSRQVFITDSVQDIVPEYLMLLQGVIDSPDIPLNVSRSYLQADSNVRKISSYITRKVADKLAELYREDRAAYEEKWPYIEIFVKYGMISDEKFYEKAADFCLYKDTEGKLSTLAEWKEQIQEKQTDKDGNLVVLYVTDADAQDAYLESIRKRGWKALLMNTIIDAHFLNKLESSGDKMQWKRVDADAPDKLIPGAAEETALLTEEEAKQLVEIYTQVAGEGMRDLKAAALGEAEMPVIITRPEFFRRWAEMSASSSMGGQMKMDQLSVLLNTSHPLSLDLLRMEDPTRQQELATQLLDLARLSQGMLTGSHLTRFIRNSLNWVR